MGRPRVRIDREGWIRNDQPWPWESDASVQIRNRTGNPIMCGLSVNAPSYLMKYDTHYRIVG